MIKIAALSLLVTLLHAEIQWDRVVEKITSHELTPIKGGASNINYKLHLDGGDYFVRCAPENVAPFADLNVEYQVLEKISDLGISAKPLYYNPQKKILVTTFIKHDSESINLLDPQVLSGVIQLLHRIQTSQVEIARTFHPYQDVINLVDCTSPDFSLRFKKRFSTILQKIDARLAFYKEKTLCHLDLHRKNILKEGDRYWIVDWEYASMSHPFLALASMASIERWSDDQMRKLLKTYIPLHTEKEFECLYLYRIVSDLFWTAWNELQSQSSPIDSPYATWRELFEQAAITRINSTQLQSILEK